VRQLTYEKSGHCLWLQGEKLLKLLSQLGSVIELGEATAAYIYEVFTSLDYNKFIG